MIQKSTTHDKELIQQLMQACFGDKNNLEPYENLDNRYYLYFKDDTLVAMSGLTSNSEYGHLEIDWTCTHPEHRHNGYMQELFTEMLNGVQEKIYCSCWRLPNDDRANLHTIMSLFGFEEVIQSRIHWKVPHNCFRNYDGGCSYCTGTGCECYEDLFLRKDKNMDNLKNMYTFRKLDSDDAPCLRNLYFQEEDLHMNIRQTQRYEARVRKVYGEMLNRGSYIYGCFDAESKKLIASITVNKCLDCYPNYTDNPYVHLETFIVHKEYQNQGIGTRLLKHVLEMIKKEGCTYVLMQSNNPTVQHVARKVGLIDSLVDMRIDFMQNGE